MVTTKERVIYCKEEHNDDHGRKGKKNHVDIYGSDPKFLYP